jgi:hypothetical protein
LIVLKLYCYTWRNSIIPTWMGRLWHGCR